MEKTETTFSFGKNWNDFIDLHFSQERVDIAKKLLLEFLEAEHLEGQYLLDIGCGSGIHSLAALQAGAHKIVSFDLDPLSVETTQSLKDRTKSSNWTVIQGSILDPRFVSQIQPADIVYSWGVLHHTGSMWKAIENAISLVKTGGLLYIALYTKTPKSPYWVKVKKSYNRAHWLRKKYMEIKYAFRYHFIPDIVNFRNPIKNVLNYKQSRGMAFWTNIKDWLGGYPYEDAKAEEVIRFCVRKYGLELVNLKTGEANTEYLFRKPSSANPPTPSR